MNCLESRYKANKTQIITTLKLIKWYKAFINSNCELAHIPGSEFNNTMTKLEAKKHLDDSLNRSINQRGELTIYPNDNKWFDFIGDKAALECIHKNIRIYQFRTKECQKRFSHLLSRYDD